MCFSAPKAPKQQSPPPPPADAPTPGATDVVTGNERRQSGTNRKRGIASLTIPLAQSGVNFPT